MPVYRLSIAETSCAAVDLAFSGVPKSGIQIRGSYGLVTSSVSCKDGYTKSITLENLKDKAVIIYEIYLRLASNCYLGTPEKANCSLNANSAIKRRESRSLSWLYRDQ